VRRFLSHTIVRVILAAILLVVVAWGLVFRRMYYKPAEHERSGVGEAWLTNGFAVAVVWPPHTDLSLVEGVKLAVEEINANPTTTTVGETSAGSLTIAVASTKDFVIPGGLLVDGARVSCQSVTASGFAGCVGTPAMPAGRTVRASTSELAGKIRMRYFVEPPGDTGRGIRAFDVVKNTDVVAVIGHEGQGSAIPASITYENHGLLFLSPKATDMRLTSHGFNYVFRLTPGDSVITAALADFAKERGWNRIGILYGRNDHGESASGLFLEKAKGDGLTIPFFKSYLEEPDWMSQDFRPVVADIGKKSFDAIMIADQLPWAAKVLVDMGRMGLTQPILATDKLDSEQIWQVAQAASNNVYVASAVDPTSTVPAYAAFRERFRRRYKDANGNPVNPGYGASQGYETMMTFVNAVLLSRSADPIVVATTLRTVKWSGLFGDFTFEPNGDIDGRTISIKRMQNGTFRTVGAMKETRQ